MAKKQEKKQEKKPEKKPEKTPEKTPEKEPAKFAFGCIRQKPDARDFQFQADLARVAPLPSRVDLRDKCPPITNQGGLGSCTAHMATCLYEMMQLKAKPKAKLPTRASRLAEYYWTRLADGNVHSDVGATCRGAVKTMEKVGVASEKSWKYIESKWDTPPNKTATKYAAAHKALSYHAIANGDINAMKDALARGYGVGFGFTVYESFGADSGGMVPRQDKSEKILGGHAVVLVGYDDATQLFLVRNSWGAEWGAGGYFYMPYEWVLDCSTAWDFWVIEAGQLLTGGAA